MSIKKGSSTACAEKRDIFGEMMASVEEMKAHREGKITLRSYKVEAAPLPTVDAKMIRETRNFFQVSRGVFAQQLRINERTLEKWEQGLGKPNKQAATLILLARKFPDTLQRLERLST
jgi:putative transcriptional regulator